MESVTWKETKEGDNGQRRVAVGVGVHRKCPSQESGEFATVANKDDYGERW